MDQTAKNEPVPIEVSKLTGKVAITSSDEGTATVARSIKPSATVKTEDVVIEIGKLKLEEESKFDHEADRDDNDGSVPTELAGTT